MTHLSAQILSAFLEGELDRDDRSVMDRHLARCPECRQALEDLRGMLATLHALPDRAPRRALWPGIRQRIAPSGFQPAARPSRSWRRFPVSPALGVAAAAVLLMGAAVVWFAMRGTPPAGQHSPDMPSILLSLEELERLRVEAYLEAIRDVESVLAEREDRMDPAAAAVIRNEMRVVDETITEIRKALQEQPESAWLREHLARALHRKWTYLREAVSLAPRGFPRGG